MSNPIILAENIIELGTPAATDTASGYDVANITDRRPYTYWQANAAGTKYVTVDCGVATTADAIGFVGHNFYTASAQVSVECSDDNFAAETIEALAAFTPASDRAVLKVFTPKNKRYWRIKMVTAAVAAKIGVVLLGDRVTFNTAPVAPFDPFPESVIAETARAKSGHIIASAKRYVSSRIVAEFRGVLDSWITGTFKPLWDTYLAELYPFFWAWDLTNYSTAAYWVVIPEDFELRIEYGDLGLTYRDMTLEFEAIKE